MQYRKLGNTDLDVSLLGLGTMTWGHQNSAADAHRQLDAALAAGVNLVDTAEMYPTPIHAHPRRHLGQYRALHRHLAGEERSELSAELGIAPAQLALAYVASRPFVSSVLTGQTSLAQLAGNLGALDVRLSEEAIAAVNKIHHEIPNPAP